MKLPPAISSRTNAKVKALRASLSGKPAAPGDLLGLEGEHLVQEAQRSGLSFETVYLRQGSEARFDPAWMSGLRTREWAVLTADVFDSAVSTSAPQGIAATWVIDPPTAPKTLSGVALILEGLQDPGNVGTLIRTAEAFGAEQIFVTPATASQWNPKVLRASAGSVFRVPVTRAPLQRMREVVGRGKIFAAVADRDDRRVLPSFEAELHAPCAIMIGNEGAGLSAEALGIADELVRIPCAVESLNAAVAGSVLLYEAARQMAAQRIEAVR